MDRSILINALLVLGLVVLVVLGLWAIRQARSEALESRPPRLEDQLAPFEEAFRRGEMDQDEYERVRRALEGGQSGRPVEKPPPRPPDPDLGEPVPGG